MYFATYCRLKICFAKLYTYFHASLAILVWASYTWMQFFLLFLSYKKLRCYTNFIVIILYKTSAFYRFHIIFF